MRKIIIGQPLLPSLSLKVEAIPGKDIVVSNEPRIRSIARLTNKVTREAWQAIDIVLRDCPADNDDYWINRRPFQAIKLVRDLATIGGGSIGLKEAKELVDDARVGRWVSQLVDITVEVY